LILKPDDGTNGDFIGIPRIDCFVVSMLHEKEVIFF
jgi:hypothetical protein